MPPTPPRPDRSRWLPAVLALALGAAVFAQTGAGDDAPSVRERLTSQLTRVVRHSDQPAIEPAILALRTLEDPRLRPLFAHLTTRPAVASRVHGWLGLAELDADEELNVELVRRAPEPEVRAMALGAAIRQGVMGEDGIRAALEWPDLEPSLKLLLASRLMRETGELDVQRVEEILEETPAESVNARVLGELLLAHERGQREAEGAWAVIERTGPLGAGPGLAIALAHIRTEELTGVAGFAERAFREAEPGSTLSLEALRTLLAVDPAAGVTRWREAWEAAEGLADRIRVGLVLLERAASVPASCFDPLAGSPGLLGEIGRAGRALADRSGLEAVVALLSRSHSPSIAATFSALGALDDEELAGVLERMLGIWIERLEPGESPPASMFEAARVLADLSPEAMVAPIRSAAAEGRTRLTQALLVALLEAEPAKPWEGELAPEWPDRRSRVLATLALARVGEPLSEEQTALVESAAMGGEGLPGALKALAAWLALRERGEEGAALAEALAPTASPGAWR